jgi:ribosomal protein S18 acetylase RimI-like enzyme
MKEAMRVEIRSMLEAELTSVVELWNACGMVAAYNDPTEDILLAWGKENSDVLVAEHEDRVVGSVMVGHDGHRGWVYYLAVQPEHQRCHVGEQLLRAAEAWLADRGVRKLMLMVRMTNTQVSGFYERLGYQPEERLIFSRWLDQREPVPERKNKS